MMLNVIASVILMAATLPATQPAEQDIPTLAQALDRCLTTYAVRMIGTGASDDAIFVAATEGCRPIETQLYAKVRRDFAPAEADRTIQQWDMQSRPSFMALLQRIRTGRAATMGQ